MRPVPLIWRGCYALTIIVCCGAAEMLNDRALNFRMTIPDGFESGLSEKKAKNSLYIFSRMPDDPSKTGVIIHITRLGGTLPSDLPLHNITKDGVEVVMEPVTWKSHTLRRGRMSMDVNGQRMIVLNVQVPLVPEAIAVNVVGAESDEQEVSAILQSVLDSLDGETNWVKTPVGTTTKEDEKVKKAITRDLFVCLFIVALIGSVFYIRRLNRRNDARNQGGSGSDSKTS